MYYLNDILYNLQKVRLKRKENESAYETNEKAYEFCAAAGEDRKSVV